MCDVIAIIPFQNGKHIKNAALSWEQECVRILLARPVAPSSLSVGGGYGSARTTHHDTWKKHSIVDEENKQEGTTEATEPRKKLLSKVGTR